MARFNRLRKKKSAVKRRISNYVSRKVKNDSFADLINVNIGLLVNITLLFAMVVVFILISNDNSGHSTSMMTKFLNATSKYETLKPYTDYLTKNNMVYHAVVIFSLIPAAIQRSRSVILYFGAVFWSVISNTQTDLMYYFTAWVVIMYSKLYKRNKPMTAILSTVTILLYLLFFTKV